MAQKLKIELTVDDKGSVTVKQFGKTTEETLDRTEKSTKKADTTTQAWASSWTAVGVAAAAAAAVAAYKVAEFGRVAIAAASDLNETISKSNAIFGDQAAAIDGWANSSAEAFGLSKQAALENTATLGNMFKQLGAGTGVAAKSSKQMVELSADLASFHNVSGGATAVLDTMASAFRGEYDALQRYIPTINAAAVQQEALAMTGKETAKELTNLEKAWATQAIIMRDAGDAVGDFAKTSDELANKERILEAKLEDLAAVIGNKLLDPMTDLVGVMTDAVDIMTIWAGGTTAMQKHAEATDRLYRATLIYNATLAYAKEHNIEHKEAIEMAMREVDKASIALGRQAVFYKQVAEAAKESGKAQEISAKEAAKLTEEMERQRENLNNALLKSDSLQLQAIHTNEQWAQSTSEVTAISAAAWDKLYGGQVESAKTSTDEITKIYDTFLERTQGAFADTFFDIYKRQLDDWGDLLDTMEDLFFRMLSEMAAQAAMTNLMPALGGAAGAGAAGAAGAGGLAAGLPWVGAIMAGMYYGDYYSQVLQGDIKPKAPWLAALGPMGLSAMPFAGEKKAHKPHVWGGAELGLGPRGTITTEADILTKLRGKGNVLGWEAQMDEMVDVALDTYSGTMSTILTAYGKYTGTQFKGLSTKIDFGGYHGTHLDNYADATMKKLGTALESYTEEIAKDLGFATFEAFQEYVTLLEVTAQASAQTIAQAFGSALETGEFDDFASNIKQTLYENVKAGIVNALMESAKFQSVLQPFYMTLTDTIEKSTAKGGFNERKFMRLMTPALAGLDAELSRLQPMFEKVAYVTDLIGGSLFPTPSPSLSHLPPLSIPSYHQGTDYVQHTGLAMVEKGERITPAGSDGGVIVTMNFHGPILANDLPSILADGIEQVNRGRAGKGVQLKEFQTAGLDI